MYFNGSNQCYIQNEISYEKQNFYRQVAGDLRWREPSDPF